MAGVGAPLRCQQHNLAAGKVNSLTLVLKLFFSAVLIQKKRKGEQACLRGAGSARGLVQNKSADLSGVLLKNDLALPETRRKRKGFL